jgi:hypothetical protein
MTSDVRGSPAGIELATPRFNVKGPDKPRESRKFYTLKISRQPAGKIDHSTHFKRLKFRDSQHMKVIILT